MKKAQAAMEFLMTYGWAILIILIGLGALFYLGVFTPKTQNTGSVDAPFSFLDLKLTATPQVSLVKLGVSNAVKVVGPGTDMPLAVITATGTCATAAWATAPADAPVIGGTGILVLGTCGTLTKGKKFSGTVTFPYVKSGGSYTHFATLTYTGTVE